MFKGRNLIIATKHQKERVIAPVLEEELGVKCFITANFDTDELGTFTGEVERKDDPIATARKKCQIAMESANCDLAVASEGSFGPHPSIYFVPADDEFLILIDKKNGLEILVREISTETNFDGSEIKTEKELKVFADKVKFPSHALIAKNAQKDFTEIKKDITSWKRLNEVYTHFIKKYGSIYLETDMRAMYNPTRMKVIEKASIKLAKKINSNCPKCNTPGFGITDVKQGLPCEICNYPTRSVLSYIYTCIKCTYTKEDIHPNNKNVEDPMYCDVCNP
ncbi:MAG: hypothetical protein POELPBGB_03485 [Bacteroidia bacterium]|nr:hypothetical protein [Bacteroidia bacterium]